MIIEARLSDSSAFAKAVKGLVEAEVRPKLAQLAEIMEEEWVHVIDEAGLGTSREGTRKAAVTPIREAMKGRVVSSSFDPFMRVELYIAAPDAKPKLFALSGIRSPHEIHGNPFLTFPDSRTGRRIKVKSVNWRPRQNFILRDTLVADRAKRRFLALFR